MKYNYHTHTFRCKHAVGDVIDYARAAHALGITTMGASDHTPHPDGRFSAGHMELHELLSYFEAIRVATQAFPDMTILRGMECEWVPGMAQFYMDLACDYLIGSVHFLKWGDEWRHVYDQPADAADHMRRYADQAIATMHTGLFDFIAHPDSFGLYDMAWTDAKADATEAICAHAAALGIPLELNCSGYRKWPLERMVYPRIEFWRVAAAHGCTVFLTSDDHVPSEMGLHYDKIAAMRDALGLKEATL